MTHFTHPRYHAKPEKLLELKLSDKDKKLAAAIREELLRNRLGITTGETICQAAHRTLCSPTK